MSRWRAFLQSPHHAVLALGTVGAGFATGEPLYLIAGATAYVLGWIYLPDLPLFSRWLEKRTGSERDAAAAGELAQFTAQRAAIIDALTPSRRQRYVALSAVCGDIEKATGAEDIRVRKLEELMWTYLRLLTIEQSLHEFLEKETRENIPHVLADAAAEVDRLKEEVETLKQRGSSPTLDARERLLASRVERMETLQKRSERLEQAHANLALVVAEQERLEEQIKLLRADSIATKNATALSARIYGTVEHLEHTNKWLS